MDIRKIILAREKSIIKLDSEIVQLNNEITAANGKGNFPAAVALKGLIAVRVQRKDKLVAEVAALRQHVASSTAQLELPASSAAAEPPAPGPVAGKGRR